MAEVDIATLQSGITRRQLHLNAATKVLARAAQKYATWAGMSSATTVVLGTLVAARTVADKYIQNEAAVAITFAAVGIIIAAVAGLEAAFKLRDKAAKLRSLAALSESTRRQIDTQWRKEVAGAAEEQRIQAAHRLLDLQDKTLTEVQTQAAEFGVNLPHEVDELVQWTDEPYAA
jgi:hypothetical protein